jgi:hypothetical protein
MILRRAAKPWRWQTNVALILIGKNAQKWAAHAGRKSGPRKIVAGGRWAWAGSPGGALGILGFLGFIPTWLKISNICKNKKNTEKGYR